MNQDLKASKKTDHIFAMTTKIGFWQFAKKTSPDLSFGYSIDDQARALILVLFLYKKTKAKKYLHLSKIYLSFIEKAQRPDGFFHNFADMKGKFIDNIGSQDCFGRTIWALGTCQLFGTKEIKERAGKIFAKAKNNLRKLRYIRSRAYALLGLLQFDQKNQDEKIKKITKNFADNMVKRFNQSSDSRWKFFERKLIYANAILPYALLCAHQLFKKEEYLAVGLESLDFLDRICRHKKYPAPVGFEGWYEKGKKGALFGQQPIDVCDMILAAAKAFYLTKEEKYFKMAIRWFSWFFGNNVYRLTIYDKKTGGCRDGILKDGINSNEGAESTICFHLANLEIADLNKRKNG